MLKKLWGYILGFLGLIGGLLLLLRFPKNSKVTKEVQSQHDDELKKLKEQEVTIDEAKDSDDAYDYLNDFINGDNEEH